MTKPDLTFSIEEILAAFYGAQIEPNADALTTSEWCDLLGVHERQARQVIRWLLDTGKAEVVRKPIVGMDGRHVAVPAYRLTES